MTDVGYWVWLSQLRDISCDAAIRYYEHFTSIKELYNASRSSLETVNGAVPKELKALENKRTDMAERIIRRCGELGVRIVCYSDDDYPERLKSIFNPPSVLYVRGELPEVDDSLCIGIVGTRKASKYGLDMAKRIAAGLACVGAVTVTGIAEGIDSAAATGAIEAGGVVMAVLGTAINSVYPKWNSRLHEQVCVNGALISEYPPDSKTERFNFSMRNRIISGLSCGVAVVQAPEKSGALITAARALEQGRDVFAVPGLANDEGFAGSNSLIRDGAQLIRDAADIIDEYQGRYELRIVKTRVKPSSMQLFTTKKVIDKKKGMEYSDLKQERRTLDDLEQAIVAALADGLCYYDQLAVRLMCDAPTLLAALTTLQMDGYIESMPDGGYGIIK